MRSIVDELFREISDLRSVVASIEPVNSALSEHKNPVVRQYLTLRRRFDNAAFIVALYACYEKFSESLVIAFAKLESNRLSYATLPDDLLKKHLKKSAELLVRGGLSKGRYVGLSEADLVRNLAGCLSGEVPYELNAFAISAHDANLRYDELLKLFRPVGIDCSNLAKTKKMDDWYRQEHNIEKEQVFQDDVLLKVIQQRLDDLIESRNQVAHRGGSPDNLLGAPEMENTINFIESIALSIYSLAVSCYLKQHHVGKVGATQLNVKEGPFKESTVIVVSHPNCSLYVGQPIFSVPTSGEVRWGTIASLKVNDSDASNISTDALLESIGIGVNFQIHNSANIYVLNQHDDLIWEPQIV